MNTRMMPTLITARLHIRPFATEDCNFLLQLMNTPTWLRFIGDRNIHSNTDALAYLKKGPWQSYHSHGFGLSLVALRNLGNQPQEHTGLPRETAIGICGLLRRDWLDHADLGFAMLPEYTGQQYGYEACMAVVKDAARRLSIPRLSAITQADNHPAIALLRKLDFIDQGLLDDEGAARGRCTAPTRLFYLEMSAPGD